MGRRCEQAGGLCRVQPPAAAADSCGWEVAPFPPSCAACLTPSLHPKPTQSNPPNCPWRRRSHAAGTQVIRANETMYKAGQMERVILRKLSEADAEGKRHCIRMLGSFEYRNHLCLVFEAMVSGPLRAGGCCRHRWP